MTSIDSNLHSFYHAECVRILKFDISTMVAFIGLKNLQFTHVDIILEQPDQAAATN